MGNQSTTSYTWPSKTFYTYTPRSSILNWLVNKGILDSFCLCVSCQFATVSIAGLRTARKSCSLAIDCEYLKRYCKSWDQYNIAYLLVLKPRIYQKLCVRRHVLTCIDAVSNLIFSEAQQTSLMGGPQNFPTGVSYDFVQAEAKQEPLINC